MRCQSPSSCVVCSTAIAKARGEWLSDVFASAESKGMTISMLTLTVRHNRNQSLKELLTAMERAYMNMQATQAYKKLRSRYGAKLVRVLEVTHGKNGWHPHFHIAIIHEKGVDYEDFRGELERTWIKYLTKMGLDAPLPEVAVNIVENATNEQRAWYLTKASGLSSLEFTSKGSKRASNGNLGIWQIHSLAVEGDPIAKQNWLEYERAIIGKRIISPSRGMADFFGVEWKADKAIAIDLTLSEDSQMPISYKPSTNDDISFIGCITSGMWKQILSKGLTSEFRVMITEGVAPLEGWLERSQIHGHLVKYEELERLEALRVQNLEHANNLIMVGDIAFIDQVLRDICVGEEKKRVDELLNSFE